MDPSKKIGKIKEQIELEKTSRRCYPTKWGKLGQPEVYGFYNPDEFNRQLRQQAPVQGVQEAAPTPFVYSGHGDSYFVSPDMWSALRGTCRCGRRREGTHVLKCVQRQRQQDSGKNTEADDDQSSATVGNACIENNDRKGRRLPETSNALIGWRDGDRTRYKQWEQSMRYVSPVLTMPGPRITAIPYNAIIIG